MKFSVASILAAALSVQASALPIVTSDHHVEVCELATHIAATSLTEAFICRTVRLRHVAIPQ